VGYSVETAATAMEALAMLEETAFDLVVADLMMPDVNGLELAEAIRMLDPGTPLVLMTAYGSSAFESIAAHPAISYYLHKPFPLDKLIELADRVLGRQAPAD
jgi:DNA-binding NtrC family response regulator